MDDLCGTVAVVTGASRGLGKAMAVGLGERGATVYVAGRSTAARPGTLPGTVDETADEVNLAGGTGIAVPCDQRMDADVAALFARVVSDHGRVDVLINSAQASLEQRVLWSGRRFWELSLALWDDLMDVGLRSHYVASALAVPGMVEHGKGLIINVASHAAASGKSSPSSKSIIPYSVAKAGVHRLTADMAVELTGTGVAVVEVWPHASTTEGVLAQPDVFGDLTGWVEPIVSGRTVAAMVAAGNWLDRSGKTLALNDVALELAFPKRLSEDAVHRGIEIGEE